MYIADLHIHSRYSRATSPGADAGDPGAFCQAKGDPSFRHRRFYPSCLAG